MQFTSEAPAIETQKTVEEEEAIRFWEFAEVVLDQREEQGIRGIDRERSRYRCHIEHAAFARKPLADITQRDIREWYRELQKKNALERGPNGVETDRPLNRSTISRAASLVSAVFIEAIDAELIEANPCVGVKPKKVVNDGDTVERWSYLTPAEQHAIIHANADLVSLPEKLAIRFAIGTGLRAGEQFNLELPDLIVRGPDPRVIVRYSNMHRGKKQPPKNGKLREVALVGDAFDAACDWLELLPAFARSNPDNLVFPTERGCRRQQGKPLGRARSIHDVYRAAGITPRKGLHWHALRHTFATNLLTGVNGIPPLRLPVIQRLMGHSSSQVTERYAHLAADAVQAEFRAAFATPKESNNAA
jgi:integrase